jgi:hypothetical protein
MAHKRIVTALAAAGLSLGLSAALPAESVEEKFPDGRLRLKYTTDKDGKKDGVVTEYFPNGKVKLKATYKADELNGAWTSHHENGVVAISASYKKGKLHGAYVEKSDKGQVLLSAAYKDGRLDGALTRSEAGKPVVTLNFKNGEAVYGRTREQIARKIAEITAPAKTKSDQAAERDDALRRLRAYRYVSEVPYEDVVLDEEMNRLTDAAARICETIGRIDHKPPNPGLPEAEYKLAFKGASSSNLAYGIRSLSHSLDVWMNDTDNRNIEHVGHRRWCLNPALVKTGFGRSGRFSAMYSFDNSRKAIPDIDLVAYPARGYMPVEFFGPRHAWHVSLSTKKYRRPEGVKVAVYALDDTLARSSLTLDYTGVNYMPVGIPNAIVFRPEKVDLTPGRRYQVEIDGVAGVDGKPAPIRYVVEFMSLK